MNTKEQEIVETTTISANAEIEVASMMTQTEADALQNLNANDNSDPCGENCSANLLTVLGNPKILSIPDKPKDCPKFIAFCDGILKTSKEMLKGLQTSETREQYNAVMEISWQYAVLRLETQARLGLVFSNIKTESGFRSDLDNSNENDSKIMTKEKIIMRDYHMNPDKVWQHEQLNKNNLLSKTYELAQKTGELPSLPLAMRIRKAENTSKSDEHKAEAKKQARHEANQAKLQEKALKDEVKFAKKHRTEATVLENETFNVIYVNPLSVKISFEEIKDLPVPANDNSIMLVWTDSANLQEAMQYLSDSDFEYKDLAIWNYLSSDKTGTFVKQQQNILLFAIRGEGIKQEEKEKPNSVFSMHRDDADEAKNYYYEMIEDMFPDGAYLDLLAPTAYNSKWKILKNINKEN